MASNGAMSGFPPASPPDASARAAAGARIVRAIATGTPSPGLRFLSPLPPPPHHEWAALEADAAVGRLAAHLTPRAYPIPHTVATAACRCRIAGTAVGRRFRSRRINRYLSELFQALPGAYKSARLPDIELSRFCTHHAHLFLARNERAVGLLFHTNEYVVGGPIAPGDLGYCQHGTPLRYDPNSMAWRNAVAVGGAVAALDVRPDGPLGPELVMEGLTDVCTVWEEDLGVPLADVYYVQELGGAGGRRPEHRLFVVNTRRGVCVKDWEMVTEA